MKREFCLSVMVDGNTVTVKPIRSLDAEGGRIFGAKIAELVAKPGITSLRICLGCVYEIDQKGADAYRTARETWESAGRHWNVIYVPTGVGLQIRQAY